MTPQNVHVELVHDPFRHRALIGWSNDPALVKVTAEQLLHEAEARCLQFKGIDDIAAATEEADIRRLSQILSLLRGDA